MAPSSSARRQDTLRDKEGRGEGETYFRKVAEFGSLSCALLCLVCPFVGCLPIGEGVRIYQGILAKLDIASLLFERLKQMLSRFCQLKMLKTASAAYKQRLRFAFLIRPLLFASQEHCPYSLSIQFSLPCN